MSDITIAKAIHSFLSEHVRQQVSTERQNKLFFRVDGFDLSTYTALLDIFHGEGKNLAGCPTVVRTTRPIPSYETFELEAGKTATSCRNDLPRGHALVLIFNEFTSDAQSLRDIYSITEAALTDEGLDYLIRSAFEGGYSLNSGEVKRLRDFVIRCAAKVLRPQLRPLVQFLSAVNQSMLNMECGRIEEAITRQLPHLRMFRYRQLADNLNTARGDRLLRDLYRAGRIGDELLDEKTLNAYLERIDKTTFDDDSPYGLSSEQKREALRSFLTQVGASPLALEIDWREVKPILHTRARKPKAEIFQELAQAIRDAFEQQRLSEEDLPDYSREVLLDLERGEAPDANALERVANEQGDLLGRSISKKLRRFVKRKARKSSDFVTALVAVLVEVVMPHRDEISEGWKLCIEPRPDQLEEGSDGRLKRKFAEAVVAFQILYGGIETCLPSIEWSVEQLWEIVHRNRDWRDQIDEAESREKVVKATLPFYVSLHAADGNTVDRAELDWQYQSDSPAAATVENLYVLSKQMEERVFVPIYDNCGPDVGISDLDLHRPLSCLHRWFDEPTELHHALDAALSARPYVRPEAVQAVGESIDNLAAKFKDFVNRSVEMGLLSAPLDGVLAAYEALLDKSLEQLKNQQEATAGLPVIAKAFIVVPQHNAEWAVVPRLHPLKLLWNRNRLRHFNEMIKALLDHHRDVSLVDEVQFRHGLAQEYSSAGFPALLVLARRDGRPEYLLPAEETQGYEIFRSLDLPRLPLGLALDASAADEQEAVAQIAATHLASVIEDYLETYPFIKDGLEIYLLDCQNGALPGELIKLIYKKPLGRQAQINAIIHTADRGAPIFHRVEDWLRANEELNERPAGSYFPQVTLKVLECPLDDVFPRIEDRDMVVLADVLSRRGEAVEAIEETNPSSDNDLNTFLPLFRGRQMPFERGELVRRTPLNSGPQPALVRYFYDLLYAVYQRRPVSSKVTVRFSQTAGLQDWEFLLSELHEHFNWVVCYDTNIDRRLLEATCPRDKVQVIRYTSGLGVKRRHNLTVSSSSRARSVVIRRLKSQLEEILPDTSDEFRERVAERLIDEALQISGDIVLRAAGPGSYLNELIGIVLAKHLTEKRCAEQFPGALTAWIYLDDFPHWFNGRKPDLAFIAVIPNGFGELKLHVGVIETKCISETVFARETYDAENQAIVGVNRLYQAWAPDSPSSSVRLDAPYWYDQLYRATAANLSIAPEQAVLWEKFATLMTGTFNLDMSGHAWVFCYNGQGGVPATDPFTEGPSSRAARDAPRCQIFYHWYARSGLRQVLRQMVKAWEIPSPPLTWSPTYDAPQVLLSDEGATVEQATITTSPTEPSSSEPEPPRVSATPHDEQQLCASLDPGWLEQKARALDRALSQYRIRAYSVDTSLAEIGPSIARLKIRLRSGEKVGQLQSIAVDIGRELALESPPLIGNVPGEIFVAIDLQRPQREVLLLTDYVQCLPAVQIGELPFVAGVKPSGEVTVLDLATLPHLLVAGTTGSGKTIFLHSLSLCLLSLYDANALELLIIDPKQTDFVLFEGLPHLRHGRVIIDAREAVDTVREVIEVEEPHRRNLLRQARCTNILQFNKQHPRNAISPLVVVIDEFADLMDTLRRDERDAFEGGITRIAQVARSRGIHLVLATQRPSVDVITGRIKANLPCRVAFRLPSAIDSRTILDQGGAERLLGQGDMLLLKDGTLTRLQGLYVRPEDIANHMESF